MQQSEWARFLEPALHAFVATRCHRAYRHDLKNGLQGIYGGFDALTRLLQMPVRDVAKVERTTDFVRQAISSHERSMERVLHGLAPLEPAAESIDASVLLHELVKFLVNDAAVNRVALRTAASSGTLVQARPHKLRLALLSLMIDAIDAMPTGGVLQLTASSAESGSLLELSDQRSEPLPADPWAIDPQAIPAYRGLTLFVVRHLIAAEGGSIECNAAASGGRHVRIFLPRG